MKKIILVVACLFSVNAFAKSPVEKAAENMKKNDTRTVIKEIDNTEGSPCLPEGKSFQVDLQVKQAQVTPEKEVVYYWETVKTIGVEKNGRVSEGCGE